MKRIVGIGTNHAQCDQSCREGGGEAAGGTREAPSADGLAIERTGYTHAHTSMFMNTCIYVYALFCLDQCKLNLLRTLGAPTPPKIDKAHDGPMASKKVTDHL